MGEKVKGYGTFDRVPEVVYIFDINGTLGCLHTGETSGLELIPAKATFEYLRNENTWVGVWSGMFEWMQLQFMNLYRIETDFVLSKANGFNFKASLAQIYKAEPKIISIGDSDEDKSLAYLYHFEFIHKYDFLQQYGDAIRTSTI